MKAVSSHDQLATSFCLHYTTLYQIISEAKKYGQSPGLEFTYSLERAWMQRNYKLVKMQLKSNIETDRPSALSWANPLDCFERLFAKPTLLQLINQDDEVLNSLLSKTQVAVEKTFHCKLESKVACCE